MRPLDQHARQQLNGHLRDLGKILESDVVAILSPILPGLEHSVKAAVELLNERKPSLAIILDTNGGLVEVVQRMVTVVRHYYKEIVVIIPDKAMSAGTVFAMAGDRILMSYFSCLGPIDPQVEKDGRLVPALGYLAQFERLKELARVGKLTTAEAALLSKLDLCELYQYERARDLSVELLVEWLSTYKFKNWTKTESKGESVTEEMRRKRASEIAEVLSDSDRWKSHGRPIDRIVLRDELNLKIEDIEAINGLQELLNEYVGLLRDYMQREKLVCFVHSREYF